MNYLSLGDFKSELERLVQSKYTVNMEFISPANRQFVTYSQAKLVILSVRSHTNGQTLFATKLKEFLNENNYPTLIDYIVSFETIPPHITHEQLLQMTFDEDHGEGYVIEIIQPDQQSYLVKIKTKRYAMVYGDRSTMNSPRSLFEALLYRNVDDLKMLFKDDQVTEQRINAMEQTIIPEYQEMIKSVEKFYQDNQKLTKREFLQKVSENENMKVYHPLLLRLYAKRPNNYRIFAMQHARDVFDIGRFEH